MKQFMCLLRGGDRMDEFSPEQMEAHMGEWKTWMGGLAEAGKLAGGLPLGKEGKQVKGTSKVVTDGPFAAGKEIVGGYVVLNANDMNEAIELSKGCPIFQSEDSNVEVREMMEM